MNLLTPDIGLVFWMLLCFVIVFTILAKFGLPVILSSISKRKQFIEQSLVAAEQANEKLAGIEEEGKRILADAHSQQQDIIAGAMAERQQIVNTAEAQAAESAHRIAEESARNIQVAKENALREVKNEVASLALDIAEKVLREKMTDDKAQQEAIAKMLDNI
ncbi:MAG: F0F1 ATP synthase subunit B [Bacteroidaceae bacterium]|nr:F0F1 ATP synthase subunit B [Bacteroidaceae bacterium]